MSCRYFKVLGCTKCDHLFFKECKKFVVAHAKELVEELLPFCYTKQSKLSGSIVWSRDLNKSKSAALQFALKLNSRVRKLTLSQVLSLTLQSEFPESRVIYIEYATKSNGDADKIKGVLSTFVENMQLRGSCVSIYVAPSIAFSCDYTKL